MMKTTDIVDKIDVEELMHDFKIQDIEALQIYLKELWKDLSQRSDDKAKGINLVTFNQYYNLPGIILDRLFNVFDRNSNGYLDLNEFAEGMFLLFTQNFEYLVKFIFRFYDFDNDGLISKEDIRTVISYVPLNSRYKYRKDKLRYEKDDFKDRMESQDELQLILNTSFEKLTTMDLSTFVSTIENKCSEIFLYLVIFLLEKRPFNKKTLSAYEGLKKNNVILKSPNDISKKLIASPKLQSKFSPSLTIAKSPTIAKRTTLENANKGSSMLSKITGKMGVGEDPKNKLLQYAMGNKNNINKNNALNNNNELKSNDIEDNLTKNNPIRKKMHNLKNLEDDLKNTKDFDSNNINSANLNKSPDFSMVKKYEQKEGKPLMNEIDNDEESEDIRNEGHLYKITNNKKLKRLWFKQIDKDLYYYREKEDTIHKGMHNLSGVFLQEQEKEVIEGQEYYCFSAIYPKKTRIYYALTKEDYLSWVKSFRKAIGYSNLNDMYDVKQKLGNGKFGLVKLGIHKETGRKVAIKIINKANMSLEDQGLVKCELEILKICQHPNIIKLYDVFENVDNIFIIMEYCAGGDLFSYIEKRGFRLNEKRTCELIHKLSMAVCFLHSYGITHRDLKPENILMTDDSDTADMRLLDFGLSKIIGPNENCTEPYGTLSYVAPEVLTEKPYSKSVDLWTIGIITYLLLCGCLPFDDEHSEKEIARQTIHDPTPFPGCFWKKLSSEARAFVDNLLNKDPRKRMSIKDVLEHSWMVKHIKSTIFDTRRKSKDMSDMKTFVSSPEMEKKNLNMNN